MSNKLDRSKEKIKEVFKEAKKNNVVVKDGKKRLSNSTYEQYEELVMNYADAIHRDFGIANVVKWNNDHFMKYVNDSVEEWKKGDFAVSYSIKRLRSALELFRHATIKTDVFKSEIQCVDKGKVKDVLDYNYVKRSGKYTHTLSVNSEDCSRVGEQILKSRSKHKEAAYHSLKIAETTGARLMDVLALEVRNISEDGGVTFEAGSVTYEKSKGGLTRDVKLPAETVEFLKELAKDKGPNEKLIRLFKNGDSRTPMKDESAEQAIQNIVSTAGERAGLTREEEVSYKYRKDDGTTGYRTAIVEQTFSFHSGRKAFVNERYNFYNSMSPEELNKELEYRLKDEKVFEKYESAERRINRNRTSGDRELHHYEKAVFITSLDSGHFRNDVLEQFYLIRETIVAARKEARN